MSLYLVGAGGVGREALDIALAAGREVEAFLDDRMSGSVARGLPVYALADATAGASYLIAIAAPEVRARLAGLLDGAGLAATSLIHPRAVVGPDTAIAPGCLVHANSHVSSSVCIGPHGQVHYNATVGHDCFFGDRVSIYPGANVAGSVRLETGVTVGSNAVVLQGLTIGAGAFVGAGAVVTRDVEPGAVVVGTPARPLPARD